MDDHDAHVLLRTNSYTTALAAARGQTSSNVASSADAGGAWGGSRERTAEDERIFGEGGKRWHVHDLDKAAGHQVHRDTSDMPSHPLTRSVLNPMALFE